MKLLSKVDQEIEGNRWFEKKRKIIDSNYSVTESKLKTILQEALTYYLIDAISFRMFIKIVDWVGDRAEIQKMTKIEESTNRLLSLSKYSSNSEEHRQEIIETFSNVLTKILEN